MMNASDLSNLSVEPAALRQLTAEQKERLTDILDEYLSALETGVPLDVKKLLEQHPDLAEPLTMYLNRLEELHDVAAGFGGPSQRSGTPADPPADGEQRLGDFVLLREVGRGGMGVVYEARQLSLGRRVALKVLPFAAVLDSRQIARFKNEAQAAAQLLHPNIVPVFAVGVERGVHYYAMQFIDGQPLDRAIVELRRKWRIACDELSPGNAETPAGDRSPSQLAAPATCRSFLMKKSRNRQQYFRTVARLGIQAAEALHAAHEYGVVHRDVKPSNLMLDGDGKLWVTDFGLARCQSDATLTKTGDVVGTLRYMSPEQALGHTALVDQRTDVYSLGVTLYELLTLRPALPGKDGPGLMRQIEQQDPVRLRQWQPEIPADLETVVLKAMAKRREDRYTTAQQLADDLRNVLEGKPTAAKPPTGAERLHKWAWRHKRVVTAAAAACLLVVMGLAASTFLIGREKVRAERNFQRAAANFRHARDTVDHFGAQLAERLAEITGAEHVRRELLQDTLNYYREFAAQAGTDPALRAELALTYTKMGTITDRIGSTDEAIAAYKSARGILEQLVAEAPSAAEYRRELALCVNNLALLLSRSGSTADARDAYDRAIRLQEQLVAESPQAEQYQGDLARSLNNLGLALQDSGEFKGALEAFDQALQIRREIGDLVGCIITLNNLGTVAQDVGDNARALQMFTDALQVSREIGDRNRIALLLANLGEVYYELGNAPDAIKALTESEELAEELGDRIGVADALRRLGMAYVQQGDIARARDCISRAVDIFAAMRSKVHLGSALRTLGEVTAAGGWGPDHTAKARDYLLRSVAIFEEIGNEVELARSLKSYAEFLGKAQDLGTDAEKVAE
ncbi:MAG TPA: serine/threonine-protein kinase, partial [Candidatus Anammoximicrobium sp.]|nr:serine/threonine-protein kinase [Candidatus Anammoximicrobium sp.]